MNSIPSLVAGGFALAGLACAAGPILIHLLNRRRYRRVSWAAMDFLREALQRNRRVLEIRDIAVLALRTLAILLIGFALAQPFVSRDSILMWTLVFPLAFLGVLAAIIAAAMWSSRFIRWICAAVSLAAFGFAALAFLRTSPTADGDEQFNGKQPLHAVILVDNSLSMAYEEFGTSLLEKARSRARDFMDDLPEGSQVSIVPLCGAATGQQFEAMSKDDALDALERIQVVDRGTNMQGAVNAARRAAEQGPELGRRTVLLSDQQSHNWRGLSRPEQFRDFPEMQIVAVSAEDAESVENTSISSLRVAEGVADVETPTRFIAQIHHEGPQTRKNIPVTFSVDDVEVSKAITLEPNQTREVVFEYKFDAHQPQPGQTEFVPVKVSIPADRLPLDDQRHLVVPVVASIPVVFVDQVGASDESPADNVVGETKPLRKLLAPRTSRNDSRRQLIQVRHVTPDELTRELLADARLVVVAGIAEPGPAVPLLRQYMLQGGQLVIATGGEFDAAKWNKAAWLNGAGILPAPLVETPIGVTPEEDPQRLQSFELDFESLKSHPYFQIEDNPEERLRGIYASAVFFKAIDLDIGEDAIKSMKASLRKRFEEEAEFLSDIDRRRASANDNESNGGDPRDANPENGLTDKEARRLRELRPQWLLFQNLLAQGDGSLQSEEAVSARLDRLTEESMPRVLARFTNEERSPFLVERRIGKGQVLFFGTGLRSGSNTWNTLNGSMVLAAYDRILRSLVHSTLPARNHETRERLVVPLAAHDPSLSYALWRPGQSEPEMIDAYFVSKKQRGFVVDRPYTRGLYQISAYPQDSVDLLKKKPEWTHAFSVNGMSDESQLSALTGGEFEQRAAGVKAVRWIEANGEISLAGNQIQNQDMWKWFVLAVLVFLLAELLLLTSPAFRQGGGPAEQ